MTLLTVMVAIRLLWASLLVAVRTRARRRHHRMVVDLVGRPGDRLGEESGIRVLAESTPFAYCLPGVRCSRVVVSSGALDQLAPEEMEAVLTHERAHLRARHDLVLEAFTALRQAFPRWVRSRTAFDRAHLLVEMLADDAARRRVGAPPVARALVTLASTPAAPAGGLAAGGTGTLARVRRAGPARRTPPDPRDHHLPRGGRTGGRPDAHPGRAVARTTGRAPGLIRRRGS